MKDVRYWVAYSVAVLLCSGSFVRAGLLIEPLRTVLDCAPGAEQDGRISVTHEGVEPIWIETTFIDQSEEGKSGTGWIAVKTGEARVKMMPGETVEFFYKLTMPPEAVGEYRGRLRFLEVPESLEQKATIGVLSAISVPIYVNVTGTEKYSAEIRRYDVRSLSPLHVVVYLKNTGNIRLRPEGAAVSVVDTAVEEQVFYNLLDKRYPPVFPGEIKAVEIKEENFVPAYEGDYDVTFVLRLPQGGGVVRDTETLSWKKDMVVGKDKQ